jgi:multiple sugar transport system permease protein
MTIKRRRNKNRMNEAIWGYVCISPLVIGLVLFLAAPLIFSLYLSLTKYDLFNEPVFVGFDNFIRAFSENETQFWPSIKNALVMSVGSIISMIVSLVISNLLCRKLKGSNIYKMIVFIPTICSAVAVAIMWKRMFDYNYGTINKVLKLLFNSEPINWLSYENAIISLIFMGVLFGMGVNILLYTSSIKNIPTSYFEAAKLDGASDLQIFRYITIPSVSPVSFYILVTGLIGALQGFTTYQVMTNGSPSNTMMPVMIIYNYSGNDYGAFYGYASALAIILGVIIALITIFNFTISKKWVHYES